MAGLEVNTLMMQFRRILCGLLTACLSGAAGCGQDFGSFLYHSGIVKPEKVKPEFVLPEEAPILILVDDTGDLVHPRIARDALIDYLAIEFKERDLAEKVTTNEELARLRQSEPKFDRRGAREIGELVGADIVIWLNVIRFELTEELEWSAQPAYFGVTVKILDAKAKERDKVRLWPEQREGRRVTVEISEHDMRKCKDRRDAHEEMARALAVEIAKLFYEHEAEVKPKDM